MLKISPARRHFKKRIGQVNHLLITALVGLDGVREGNITLSKEFSTSWNPRDVRRSADRSARLILDAALSWVVDNLDSYFIEAYRKPSIIESEAIKVGYSKADRSVNAKFELFWGEIRREDGDVDKYAALVALAIQWRNNTVHYAAENTLSKECVAILLSQKEFYREEFCHLDIDKMLSSYNSKREHPSFKEVSSMIVAIHRFVEHVDAFLLKALDVDRFKNDLLDKHCSENGYTAQKIKTFSEDRKKSFFETLYRQYGIEEVEE